MKRTGEVLKKYKHYDGLIIELQCVNGVYLVVTKPVYGKGKYSAFNHRTQAEKHYTETINKL